MRLLSVALLALVAFAGQAQFKNDKRVLFDKKTFPLSAVKNLELSTSGGAIFAEGTTEGEAVLEVYVGYNQTKSITLEEAQKKIAEDYEYKSGLNGGTLFAEAKRKSSFWGNDKKSVNVSYRVIVPVKVSSNLKTSGGSIQINHLEGKESIATSGGSLKISKIEGKLDANTSGGSIDLSSSNGKLSIRTSGGALNMVDLSGTVEALTSGGSIRAENITGSLVAKTSGGSVSLSNISATTEASTSGGSVQAQFKEVGKGVSLTTSGGAIHLTVPKNKGYNIDLHGTSISLGNAAFNGSKTKTLASGTINGGGVSIMASTSAGNVSFNLE